MPASFYSALSGMRSHQQWIDVIGNNLANQNTPGYKKSRAVFADNFSQNFRFASGPRSGVGGINPMQVGYGVGLASVDQTFTQGALSDTGRVFDLALEGGGFFALEGGEGRSYTRVGTFGLDSQQNLVDQGTGMRVLDPNGASIALDVSSLFPPQVTSEVTMKGNLSAVVSGPSRRPSARTRPSSWAPRRRPAARTPRPPTTSRHSAALPGRGQHGGHRERRRAPASDRAG